MEREAPYFDRNGNEIKECAVLKVFHFTGRNRQNRGRKNYYMYKWVELRQFKSQGMFYWFAMHLDDKKGEGYWLKAVAGKDRVIQQTEILNLDF